MIKFTGMNGCKPLLGLGLSRGNCAKLLDGQPIVIECGELGLAPLTILLMGGETEESMAVELLQGGALHGAVIRVDHGPLHPGPEEEHVGTG